MSQRAQVLVKSQVFDPLSYRPEDDLLVLPKRVQEILLSAWRLQAFYQNADVGEEERDLLIVRDLWEILRQLTGQRVIVVELHYGREPRIVAASILADYELPVIAEQNAVKVARFLEVGTHLCVLNGFNIQELLLSSSILDTIMHDAKGIYFGTVYADNNISNHNVRKAGSLPWDRGIPSTLQTMVLHRIATKGSGKKVNYYRAGIGTVRTAAQYVAAIAHNPIVPRKPAKHASRGDLFPDISEIEVIWDRRPGDAVLECARRINEKSPGNVAELMLATGNDSISDEFLWTEGSAPPEAAPEPAATDAVSASQQGGCLAAVFRLLGRRG